MVKIRNTTATAEEIKQQAKECLTTYKMMTGKTSILKYDQEMYESDEYTEDEYEFDINDVDTFIYAFEEEFNLEHLDDTGDLEYEIHCLSARDNKINYVSAFRLCLKWYVDVGWWD